MLSIDHGSISDRSQGWISSISNTVFAVTTIGVGSVADVGYEMVEVISMLYEPSRLISSVKVMVKSRVASLCTTKMGSPDIVTVGG